MRHVSHYMLAAVATFAAPAIAQQQPAPSNDESSIVVEGVRVSGRQIATFIDALTDVAVDGQISRFDRVACPAAMGLTAEQNAAIVARLRAVAESAGINAGEPGCRPNVMVVVTRNKRAFIEQLSRRYPVYFNGMQPSEVQRLAQSPGPAAAWQVRGLIGPDGQEVPISLPNVSGDPTISTTGSGRAGAYINGAGENRVSVLDDDALVGADFTNLDTTYSPGRLRSAARPHFAGAVVVVEAAALTGLTTTQFADYAAMRTFAATDPAAVGRAGVPTILNVVDAPMNSVVPLTMTHWDLSFLRALYAIPQNHFANIQRSNMRQLITEELFELSGQPGE